MTIFIMLARGIPLNQPINQSIYYYQYNLPDLIITQCESIKSMNPSLGYQSPFHPSLKTNKREKHGQTEQKQMKYKING